MFRRDRLEEGSLMVMEMASNDDELMWSKVYERQPRRPRRMVWDS